MRDITRPRPAPLPVLCLLGVALLLVLSPAAVAYAQPETDADAEPAQAEPDGVAQAIEKVNKDDNGLTINREGMYVDVSAKVVLRSAEFLEMFACTPDSREHESLLTVKAQPSMIHLSLLLLGQEPGKPLHYDRSFDPPKLVPPAGPEVRLFVVTTIAGREREVPANRWVMDTNDEEMMPDNVWLFAGSVTTNIENERAYLADLNGSAISLVNFGDDLLTLPNKMTQDNASHGKTWAPRTEAIPRVGTEVVLRLRVQAKAPEADGEADAQAKPETKPAADSETKPAADSGDDSGGDSGGGEAAEAGENE